MTKTEMYRRAFAVCIRELRLKTGEPQDKFAYRAKIDRSYYAELERGLSTPSLETIYKLLPRLKITFPKFAREYDRTLQQLKRGHKHDDKAIEPTVPDGS